MSVTINGTNGLTFSDASTQNTAATGFGFKNRLINSAMMIDQRNAGASVTPTTSTYTLDRYYCVASVSSKFSIQQNAGSVTPPAGFSSYAGMTSLSAYTVGAAENFGIRQSIEGTNVSDLAWGTANAATVTLSFWVRSSLTGTFGGALKNNGSTRSYPFTYTISAANTWELKSITIAGDTSGVWATDTGVGLTVHFSLGSGSTYSSTAGSWASGNYNSATGATSVVGTSGATFYITGVQLEKGSTATSFDYRPYGTELALCQRYYEKSYAQGTVPGANDENGVYTCWGSSDSAGNIVIPIPFKVTKRATPSANFWSTTGVANVISYNKNGGSGTSAATLYRQTDASITVYGSIGANWTIGNGAVHWAATAEL